MNLWLTQAKEDSQMKKKTIVGWLVVMACAGAPLWAGGVEEPSAAGSMAESTAQVSYFFKDYGRYPLDPEKHIVFRELGDKFNIEWELGSAPGSEYNSKVSVILASGDIRDIMLLVNQGNSRVAQWGDRDGYFLDLAPHLAEMPHLLSNFLTVIPDGIKNSMTDTGAIYSTGNYKTSTADNFSQGFSYRKDVFDKHGMTPGNTFNAFYENLKQLKMLYPDTFPFSVPGGSDWLITYSSPLFETGIGYGGKPVLPMGVYYDFWGAPPSYAEGGTGDNYRTMLQFLHRLYAEALLHPEFTATGSATYQKLIVNNQIFMGMNRSWNTPDTVTRAGRKENDNPDFMWMWAEFPSYHGPGKTYTFGGVSSGAQRVVSATTKHLDRILQVFDYMFTEEYVELFAYGVEGETFNYDDKGQPQYMDHVNTTDMQWAAGLNAGGEVRGGDFPGQQERGSREAARRQLAFYDKVNAGLPAEPYLTFTEEEGDELRELEAVNTYLSEMAYKFIIGEESFDNWDSYVARCKELGIERKVAIYNQAFERYQGRAALAADLLSSLGY
jgi:putative aldouronate transport system substrate-binding protein